TNTPTDPAARTTAEPVALPATPQTTRATALDQDNAGTAEVLAALGGPTATETEPPAEVQPQEETAISQATDWRQATSALNLRNAPGTNDTSVQTMIAKGGRVAVIGKQSVNGEEWNQVVPLDCEKLRAREKNDDLCQGPYWAVGKHLSQTEAPSND